jgi:hypothetical protein
VRAQHGMFSSARLRPVVVPFSHDMKQPTNLNVVNLFLF